MLVYLNFKLNLIFWYHFKVINWVNTEFSFYNLFSYQLCSKWFTFKYKYLSTLNICFGNYQALQKSKIIYFINLTLSSFTKKQISLFHNWPYQALQKSKIYLFHNFLEMFSSTFSNSLLIYILSCVKYTDNWIVQTHLPFKDHFKPE